MNKILSQKYRCSLYELLASLFECNYHLYSVYIQHCFYLQIMIFLYFDTTSYITQINPFKNKSIKRIFFEEAHYCCLKTQEQTLAEQILILQSDSKSLMIIFNACVFKQNVFQIHYAPVKYILFSRDSQY